MSYPDRVGEAKVVAAPGCGPGTLEGSSPSPHPARPPQELVILRGLPASGKTTWARAWVAYDPTRYARVSRDDFRAMLFDATDNEAYRRYFAAPDLHVRESAVTAAQEESVRGLLANGRSVVVDDTNLRVRYVRKWAEMARDAGAHCRILDFFEVPFSECIKRDVLRGERVGQDVIMDMYRKFSAKTSGSRWARNEAQDAVDSALYGDEAEWTYVPDKHLPRAWIVDIDGTVASHNGRSPYDLTRVSKDLPNKDVIRAVRQLGARDWIVFVSGREDSCRADTEAWLERHVGSGPSDGLPFGARKLWHSLHMRETGDRRSDEVAKMEIMRDHVAPHFWVQGVLDDRNRVVRMWRRVGILCLQVADGAF